MNNEKLQAYFKFDDADLEANRNNKFTGKQKVRLAALNTRERISGKILGIVLVCVGVFVLIAAPFWYANPSFICAALPIGLVAGVIGVVILRSKPNDKSFRLRKMQGKVTYTRHVPHDIQGPQFRNRIIHIGKSWFDTTEDMPTILEEGAQYNVYTYAFQGTTHILSAELITEDEKSMTHPPN